MRFVFLALARRAALALSVATLAACGGGGGGGGTTPPPADARNGSYTAYAANGERYTLTLDFNQQTYAVASQVSAQPLAATGRFRADTEAGTYIFQPDGAAEAPTVKFRTPEDLVVGNLRLADGILPFIAARRFAQTAADAAGTFNVFGINRTGTALDSRIFTQRIQADGTLQVCSDNVIYAMAQCPTASTLNHTLTVTGGLFTATRTGTGETHQFRVALAGSEKIHLLGAINVAEGTRFFRIGLLESAAFPNGSARGGTTLGEWGTATFTSTSYSSTGFAVDGLSISLAGALAPLGPPGMRVLTAPGGNAFVLQNAQLGVLVGARNGPATGYLQLGSK